MKQRNFYIRPLNEKFFQFRKRHNLFANSLRFFRSEENNLIEFIKIFVGNIFYIDRQNNLSVCRKVWRGFFGIDKAKLWF